MTRGVGGHRSTEGLKELHLDEGQDGEDELQEVHDHDAQGGGSRGDALASGTEAQGDGRVSSRAEPPGGDISSSGSGGPSMTVTSRDLSPPPSAAGAAGGKQHRSKEVGSTTRGAGSMTEKDGSVSIHTRGTRGVPRIIQVVDHVALPQVMQGLLLSHPHDIRCPEGHRPAAVIC